MKKQASLSYRTILGKRITATEACRYDAVRWVNEPSALYLKTLIMKALQAFGLPRRLNGNSLLSHSTCL
jgi:hypothetical protein